MPKLQTIIQNAATTIAVLLVAGALGREIIVLSNSSFESDSGADFTDARDVLPPAPNVTPPPVHAPMPISRN